MTFSVFSVFNHEQLSVYVVLTCSGIHPLSQEQLFVPKLCHLLATSNVTLLAASMNTRRLREARTRNYASAAPRRNSLT